MTEGPIPRIVRESGVPDLLEVLAERLSPTDLQSLMLEVYRRRAGRVSPGELLSRYQDNRFSQPATLDPRSVTDFEAVLWPLLPAGFEGVELSPLCPLGTSSVVATVDQHKVVSTVRNAEVVADSTNVLALEAAIRRRALLKSRASKSAPVGLVACQRQTRAQSFHEAKAWAHFRMVAVVSAGRDRGSHAFEAEALCQHIGLFTSVLGAVRPDWRLRVALTDLTGRSETWESPVLAVLDDRYPHLSVGMDPTRESGRGYYVDACYKLFASDASGAEVELGDGGCTTWTRQLLSDDKERLVIGGLGVDRILAAPPS